MSEIKICLVQTNIGHLIERLGAIGLILAILELFTRSDDRPSACQTR